MIPNLPYSTSSCFDNLLFAVSPPQKANRNFRPSKTNRSDDESALIGCILRKCEILPKLPLAGQDFAEFGHGEAFEILRYEYEKTAAVSPTFLYRQLTDELAFNPAVMIGQWLTEFVQECHWRHYAGSVATTAYIRHEAATAIDRIADINDLSMTFAEYDQRAAARELQRHEFRTRLEGFLR